VDELVGNILQNTFYAGYYILLSGIRPARQCKSVCSAATLCYFSWNWC